MLVPINLLEGCRFDVACEGAAIGGGQAGGALIEWLLRIDGRSLLLLLWLLRLLLLIGGACGRGCGVTLGEVINPRLSGVLAV